MAQDLMETSKKDAEVVEKLLIQGDLSSLNPEQRVLYYNQVCTSLKLNPLTKPFDYITLNGKLTLYAKRDCTDQLRKNNQISIEVVSREKIGDVYVVSARAKTPDGRVDESTGCVAVGALRGDQLANAYMKAETKAKRRVTLSICGLGTLDESEVPESNSHFVQSTVQPVKPALHAITADDQKFMEDETKKIGLLNLLKNKAHELAIDPQEIKKYMKESFNVESSKEMSLEQINQTIAWLEKQEMNERFVK